jgi:hypothetical protein
MGAGFALIESRVGWYWGLDWSLLRALLEAIIGVEVEIWFTLHTVGLIVATFT